MAEGATSPLRGTTSGLLAEAASRGLALFFGLFSLANSLGWLRGAPRSLDIWWVDLSFAPRILAGGFGLVASALLVAWAISPRRLRGLDVVTTYICAMFCAIAVENVVAFYVAWHAHAIMPALPVPASLLYVAAFAWLAWRSHAEPAPISVSTRMRPLAVAAVFLVLVIAFPLVQTTFFGSTDYRRRADVAVVLGAEVYRSGMLSTALEDRVRTGADLYRAGLVRYVVMSGAVGASGVDEPVAMRRRAVELGVPPSAIVLDSAGDNTDATVAHTTVIFRRLRVRRVLAVSQFWHLPRIKLAYLVAGWDVQTVPATFSRYMTQTPYLMLREIPAFWEYWARSIV